MQQFVVANGSGSSGTLDTGRQIRERFFVSISLLAELKDDHTDWHSTHAQLKRSVDDKDEDSRSTRRRKDEEITDHAYSKDKQASEGRRSIKVKEHSRMRREYW